jgi:hypothetical protein
MDPTECTADELLEVISAEEVIELVEWLATDGRALCPIPGSPARRVPKDRDFEMLRLRLLDNLTLKEIGERYGITQDLPRRALKLFGLTGRRRW